MKEDEASKAEKLGFKSTLSAHEGVRKSTYLSETQIREKDKFGANLFDVEVVGLRMTLNGDDFADFEVDPRNVDGGILWL